MSKPKTDRNQEIVRLRDDEELFFKQIGNKFNISESYASRVYRREKRKAKRLMSERNIQHITA